MINYFKIKIIKNKIETIGYAGLVRLLLYTFFSLVGTRIGSDRRRYLLSLELDKLLKSTIIAGRYEALKLPAASNWNSNERGCILIGFYEMEIVNELSRNPLNYRNLIVLGAGDGLHAVGAIKSGLFDRCIAYESSLKRRILINECAKLNSVSAQIEIFSEAKKNFYSILSREICRNAFVLVDIEGGEFDLLDNDFFNFFRSSIIIVENHSFLFTSSSKLEDELILRSVLTHSIKQINTGSRSFEGFEILKHLSDNDRWLLCSEGRGQSMNWFRFDPIET